MSKLRDTLSLPVNHSLDSLARHAPATDDLLQLAEWLTMNGPAHLNEIERIELAERLITRRRFITAAGGLLGAAALGACGAGEEAAAPVATVAATRTVTDLYERTVTIPVDPQRIVAIDYGVVSVYVTALGLPVVASTTNPGYPKDGVVPPEFIGGRVLEAVGDTIAANFERIAQLRPDLIIANTYTEEEWKAAEAIAPVIAIAEDKLPQTGMFNLLRWLGDIFDRKDAAARIEQETLTLMAEFDLLRGKRVAMINTLNYAGSNGVNAYLYAPKDCVGGFLELLGAIADPPTVDGKALTTKGVEVSVEVLPELLANTDVIIALAYGLYNQVPGDMENLNTFLQAPIWAAIPAVKRGDVAVVEFETVTYNLGLEGMRLGLKQIAEQINAGS